MINYFLVFMLFASPCLAGMGIGGFPYPGPGVPITGAFTGFCDGTDLFCTSWETGSDALNTGATGNEDVFNSSVGTFTRTTGGADGTYRIIGDGAYIIATNGGSGFGESVTVTGYFKFDDENAGESEILQLFEPISSYELVRFQRAVDGNTSDNLIPINFKAKLTSFTPTDVSIGVVSLSEDVWYHYSLIYNLTTNNARFTIYDSVGSVVLDTGNLALTIDPVVGIPEVRLLSTAYGNISHDAIRVTP